IVITTHTFIISLRIETMSSLLDQIQNLRGVTDTLFVEQKEDRSRIDKLSAALSETRLKEDENKEGQNKKIDELVEVTNYLKEQLAEMTKKPHTD
ncbi:MAG: hypothetical protein ABR572_13520, partial [Cryomorphaceae bacterium]